MEPQVNDCVAIDVGAFLRDQQVMGSFKCRNDLLRDDATFLVVAVAGNHVAVSAGSLLPKLYAPIPKKHITVDWRPMHTAGKIVMLTRNPDFEDCTGWQGDQALLHCGRLLKIRGPVPASVGYRGYHVNVLGGQGYSSVAPEVYEVAGDAVYCLSERSMLAINDVGGVRVWLETIDSDRAEWWESDPPQLSRDEAEAVLFGEDYQPEERRAAGVWTCPWCHQEVPGSVPALYKDRNGRITAL